MMMLLRGFMFFTLILLSTSFVKGTQKNVQAEKGASILLPCDIDSAKCGDLHSIKWYRGSARIYVFSHVANIARPEGSNTSRMEVQYVPGSTESHLQIRALELTDEAVYKCEITYMEVRENCDVVQFVNLTTLVKPSEVRIKKDGIELEDGSLLGPYNEYTQVTLECEAIGGKPVPQVSWYNGSRKMNGDYSTVPDGITHGIGNGRSVLRTTLQRGDLLTNYECRVENDALSSPIVKRLTVDVHVRPTDIKLTGVEKHVVKGTNVLLECNVRGARPAANVTWYNGTKPMKEISEINTKQTQNGPITRIIEKDDGTYETQSRLLFTASRFENGKSITCKADNSVMREERETPMDRTITLEVYYPPIVSVEPENITVNESVDVLLMCQYEANPASLNVTQWLKDGKNLTISDKEHYEGGDTEQPALHIKKVTREDMGRYSCVLGNSVGQQESENDIFLNVHYKPVVRLTMDPPSPIIQKDQINVTLRCNVESGNPDTLLAVRWYMDGEMLKQLPDCNNTSAEEPFCDVDPNIMLLTNVGKEFAGNHTCEGMNEAGWGPRSNNTELVVYYPPTNTELIFEPSRVIKKSSVTLKCSVGAPGQPEITKYRWMRGDHLVPDITTAEWTINPVTLETRSDFTCIPYNEGGDAEPASVYIQVYAPPAIISKPHPYHGALYNAKHINISCRIECYPLCDVVWLKNDQLLDLDNTDLYYVIKNNISENIRTNDFESIHSILVWNMTAWPNEQLDRLTDNANYTCKSKSNGVGEGVNLTIYFAVEYPPEQITLSNTVVNVIENHIPEKVLCSAKALPEPTYQWRRESTNEVIITGNKLIIDQPVPRQDAGNYICEVYNRHGSTASPTVLKVLYKPECQISQTVIDGNDVLVCSVKAEPEEVDFQWKINGGNETVDDELVKNEKLRSILTLDSSVEEKRTYLCYANNSVGTSFACERDVNANQEQSSEFSQPGAIPFWKRMSNDELLILVAVILAVILCVTIICVIIIIVCRRKRANDKYNNPVELEEREKPEGHNNPPQEPQSSPSSATHKWPLKPGVLVHVNRMHSLSMGRLTNMSLAAGLNLTNNNNNNNTTQSYSTVQNSTVTKTSSPSSCSSPTSRLYRNPNNQRRAKSLGSLVRDADSGSSSSHHHQSRAFRLKQIFTRGFGGTIDDTFADGVFRGSSGVVTFKKLPTPSPNEGTSSVSRKRKKPGPSQSNTADKNNLNKDNPSETLTDPDRGFYENLPFHGMQNPPNKPFKPEFSDLDYADVDYRSYGPINYKAASIYAQIKKVKDNKKMEEDKEYDDLL
ncbi:hemicentin-1 [Chrysoperla carnea]|uniref:hemicentin-1 n=1 Tax=Chrysoperla carnea TaxID=189513 RepID=UPI001D06A653|nr:hemicentin-1 [Chrysoperla carnea]